MDEALRDSLMEWYLRFGGRVIDVQKMMKTQEWVNIRPAWRSSYIQGSGLPSYSYKITPAGIEALKDEST